MTHTKRNALIIHYNTLSAEGKWGTQALVSENGTEGRLAIDNSGNPHVVYTTGGKIGYRKHDGNEWSEEELIESNFGGSCSKPDVAVEGSGHVHITYTDTRGKTGDPYDEADIMYATNNMGTFDKTLIYNGFKDYIENYGPYTGQTGIFYEKGSWITLNSSGAYHILSYERDWRRVDKDHYNTHSIMLKSNDSSAKMEIETAGDIYGIISGSGKIVALYLNNGAVQTAELTVSDNTINFTNSTVLTGAGTPHSVATDGTNIVVIGLSGNNLKAFYNGTDQSPLGITVKGGTKTAAVYVDGKFYALYTDSGDGEIKTAEITN